VIVTPAPQEPYQSAKHKKALAQAEAQPIQVGVPGAASHGRAQLARGPKDPADLTNAGLKQKVGRGKPKTVPPGRAP
jgi:hypothetical protein